MKRYFEPVSVLLILPMVLLPFNLLAEEDLAKSCAAKPSLTESMECLAKIGPAAPPKSKDHGQNHLIPESCAALTRLLSLPAPVAAPSGVEKLTADLKFACEQEKNLQVGNYFLAQRRFSEAIDYFIKIGDSSKLPGVVESARNGLRTATILKPGLVMPPQNVVNLEKQGDFDKAYRELTKAAPDTDPHRKSLAAYLQLERNAASLEQRREYEAELTDYKTYRQGLDRVRDEYLYAAVDAKIGTLGPLARKLSDEDARTQMKVAELQMSHGAYSEAVTTLSAVTGKSGTSQELIADASARLAQARIKAAEEPTFSGVLLKFFWSLPKALADLGNWLFYALVIVAVFLLIWVASLIWVKVRDPHKSILISMTDRTSTAGAQADQILSEQIRRQMDLPLAGRNSRMDTAHEMDGSSLGHVNLVVPFLTNDTVLKSGSPVTLGPFSINPFVIASQFKNWFARRHMIEVNGELYVLGSNTVCSAKLTFGELTDKGPWEVLANGETARDQAIRGVAMKVLIAIDSEAGKISKNSHSLSLLRLGLDFQKRALDDPGPATEQWTQARICFQQSAEEDPRNWLARLNLGTAMRNLGLNALAATQFEELEKGPYLPPEYHAVVAYNRAAALQKTDDKDISQIVINMMDEILKIDKLEPDLKFMASSGKLATIAVRYYRNRRRQQRIGAKQESEQAKKLEYAKKLCLDLLNDIETAIAKRADVPGAEFTVVMAVTLNALAQLEAMLDSPHDARIHYRRALTFLPCFVEANLNLAELYLERKGSLDANWPTRTERLLLDVQNLDTNNTRCAVLLGSLYANPVYGRFDDAVKQLTAALPDPNAGLRLAGIYFEQGKPSDAITPLLSALAQDTSLGSGHLLMARCALALDPDDRRKCELLRRAESWLKQLVRGKGGSQYERDAKSLLPRISAAVAVCDGPKPAPTATQLVPVPAAPTSPVVPAPQAPPPTGDPWADLIN